MISGKRRQLIAAIVAVVAVVGQQVVALLGLGS